MLLTLICLVVLFGTLASRAVLSKGRYSSLVKGLLFVTVLGLALMIFSGGQTSWLSWILPIVSVAGILASAVFVKESLS